VADWLALVGGRVRALDDAGTVAEAVLIEDGAVAAVGTSRDVLARAGDRARVVELDGRTALPGMIDAHAHLELSALAEQRWVDVRFVDVPTVLERLAAAARARPDDGWLVAQATFAQPLPSREQLDALAPGRPILIRESMHRQVASSAALAAAGIDRRFVEPVGTRVLRSADGAPTGVIEEGFDLFPAPAPDAGWLGAALARQAVESFVRHGVTTIHELPASPAALAAWQGLAAAGRMPCRVVLNPILAPGHQPTVSDVADVADLRRAIGDDGWLTVGAVKLFLDGAGDAAWTRAQLARSPAGWGLPGFSYPALRAVLAAARDHGVQVWMHAVGDLAQELALDAVEETNRTHPAADHRTRIEHVGNAVTDPAILPRLAPAGVVPVPTASFMHRYRPRPGDGEPGGNLPFPFRTLLRLGLEPPGNSDSAGTQPFATSPWHGVHAMVRRRNGAGEPVPAAGEALDLDAAVRVATRFAARATFAEARIGSLEPGKAGDLAVYRDDPFALPLDALPALEADLTVVAGRVVWERVGP
jgi:predicted amidohydrolase YtcJ